VWPPCKVQLRTHPTSPQAHLGFHLLRCCTVKTSSSRSSACTYDRESRSPKLSFSMILHRERASKVFGKHSKWGFWKAFYIGEDKSQTWAQKRGIFLVTQMWNVIFSRAHEGFPSSPYNGVREGRGSTEILPLYIYSRQHGTRTTMMDLALQEGSRHEY
jgi:hypothetical protein